MKYFAFAMVIAALGFSSIAFAEELSKSDQIHIAVQQICPISGQKLGEHETPLKVKIGEEHLFVCCQRCLQDKAVNPQHWATIHANFAKAQRICPIMKKELPANPKWTIVEGQIFYVCCPPCTKKIEADPATYLKQVEEYYTASLRKQQPVR